MNGPRNVFTGEPPKLDEETTTALPTHAEALACFNLRSSPPKRVFLVDRLLPSGVVGLVVAAGGTGKSFAMASLALAVATGSDFIGYAIPKPRSVVLLSAEDDSAELHRRFSAILEALDPFADTAWRNDVIIQLESRLHVVSLVGKDSRFCVPNGQTLERSKFLQALVEWLREVDDLGLVLVDPVSRFFGGVENSADHGTRFVESLEAIRVATGTAVIGVHHANKAAISGGDDSQTASRGSSALTDGVRWQLQLRTMSFSEAAILKVPRSGRRNYVHFSVTKMNYGAHPSDGWLERTHRGVLIPKSFEGVIAEKLASQKTKIMKQLAADQAASRHLTKTGFVAKHGGVGNTLGIGQKTLRGLLAEMIEEGQIRLTTHQSARGRPQQILTLGK